MINVKELGYSADIKMNNLIEFYPESKFGGFTDIDGTISFFTRINSLIEPSFTILDVGCGRGEYIEDLIKYRRDLRKLQGKVAKVIGIDVNITAKKNPYLDEFHLIDGTSWPLNDSSVDLIVCDNVLEHITTPEDFFSEIRRVLKNNGYLCFRTPNKWNYIALLSRLIPNSYHAKVTGFAQKNRKQEDVFPTLYKCNSVGTLKRIMKKYGFSAVVYGYEAEPSYLNFSKFAYLLGVVHQKFAPKFCKAAIFGFGKIKKTTK